MIGNDDHPTFLCDNRDELFIRPTLRGRFSDGSADNILHMSPGMRYSPFDVTAGGSWYALGKILSSSGHLRFAVVLNLDTSAIQDGPKHDLRSRGDLVREFMESDISAFDYAKNVFESRGQYRPFNLIISDGEFSAYYISGSIQQSEPEKLISGKIYGISNEFMGVLWRKVENGVENFQQLITSELLASLYLEQSKQLCSVDYLSMTPLVFPNVEAMEKLMPQCPQTSLFLQQCLAIMTDATPLPDPDFGMEHLPLTYLAAIYARPTTIRHGEGFTEQERYGIVTTDSNLEEIFGTRSITLALHYSQRYVLKHSAVSDAETLQQPPGPLLIVLEDETSMDFPHHTHSINLFTNLSTAAD